MQQSLMAAVSDLHPGDHQEDLAQSDRKTE